MVCARVVRALVAGGVLALVLLGPVQAAPTPSLDQAVAQRKQGSIVSGVATVIARGSGGFPDDWVWYNDWFGSAIGRVGDVNGDGLTDFVVGAMYTSTAFSQGPGSVYVLQMTAQRTVGEAFQISKGLRGFEADIGDYDNFGVSVDGVGDLDGNGVPDIAAGSWTGVGTVFVMLMGEGVLVNATVAVTSGQGGFGLPLSSADSFGSSLAGVGDLNSDGVPDIAVGAQGDSTGARQAGAVYVLFMARTGNVSSAVKIASAVGGLSSSLLANDFFGWRVAALGDVNGDGVADIAVGASGTDRGGKSQAGSVYILHLAANGTVRHDYEITSHVSGFDHSLAAGEWFSVPSRTGDVDGDGIDDLAVGAEGTNSVYVLLLDGNGLVREQHQIAGIEEHRFGDSVSFLAREKGVSLLVGSPQAGYGGQVFVVDLVDRSSTPTPSPSPSVTPSTTPSRSPSASLTASPSLTPSPSPPAEGGNPDAETIAGAAVGAAVGLCACVLLFRACRRRRGSDGANNNPYQNVVEEPVVRGDGAVGEAPALPQGKEFHAFLSHNWGPNNDNHNLVSKINHELKKRGLVTWFDQDKMLGDIGKQMENGIDKSCVVVVFVTGQYMDKVNKDGTDNCKAEFNLSVASGKPMVAVVTDEQARNIREWKGPVRIYLANLLYHDMCEPVPAQGKVDRLFKEICGLCAKA